MSKNGVRVFLPTTEAHKSGILRTLCFSGKNKDEKSLEKSARILRERPIETLHLGKRRRVRRLAHERLRDESAKTVWHAFCFLKREWEAISCFRR
jgi:hypothetical protein